MTRKKNSLFTFCCSLVPGAGQMYMGFMKRGLSLMSIFGAIIFIAGMLNFEPLIIILPIVWFYGFFDTHNLRAMADDEFYALEDCYIIIPDLTKGKELLQTKYRMILAGILILGGIAMLWENVLDVLAYFLPQVYYWEIRNMIDFIPQILIAIAIIAFGIYLIRGKKKELDSLEKAQENVNEKIIENNSGFGGESL